MHRKDSQRPRILESLWHILRFPILALLVILEPVIAMACGALALLGILTTVFFRLIAAPHFPILAMLTTSIGFVLVLVLYEGAIRVLSD